MNERVRRGNEALEKWVWLVRLALKFGVELGSDVKRMSRDFDYLHQLAVGSGAAKDEPGIFELFAKLVVELVTVAVALVHHKGAVDLRRP
jgi:hypothetical protein